MKNSKFIVKTKTKSYPIYFGSNILNTIGKLIKKNLPNVNKICIISDKKLPKLLLKRLIKSLKKYDLKIYKLPVSEKTKNLQVVNKIVEQLLIKLLTKLFFFDNSLEISCSVDKAINVAPKIVSGLVVKTFILSDLFFLSI